MKYNKIFIKIFALFIVFTILIMGFFYIVQVKYLEKFYHHQKITQMKNYSILIQEKINHEVEQQEILEYLQEVSEKINGRIQILDREGNVIYYTNALMGMHRIARISQKLWWQVLEGKMISYRVQGTMGRLDYLAVLIPVEQNVYIYHAPLQPIDEAITINQQFTRYLFVVAFVVALLLSLLFSKTITKPLTKINKIAKEMAKLNFDVSWKDKRKDEIGELGESLNYLTDVLKNTIKQLEGELKKEKNLEKMRRQFVARVSHELQTPISLIKGYTEALEDDIAENEDERNRYFNIIQEEIEKTTVMVRELLDLSQLESGNFKVKKESIEIAGLIHRVLSKFEILKKEKEIITILTGHEKEYKVIADEYRIEQVLNNLLRNAMAHCKAGGKIEVNIIEEKENIKIEIYNEGATIEGEQMPFIWESFYKGSEEKVGTGLGLAIVKNVLILHQSNYGVRNVGDGVVFYFDLRKV